MVKVIDGVSYITTGDMAKKWNVPARTVSEVIHHSKRLPEAQQFPAPDIKNPTRHYWKAGRLANLSRWWNQHSTVMSREIMAATIAESKEVETIVEAPKKEETPMAEAVSAYPASLTLADDTSVRITLDESECWLVFYTLQDTREELIQEVCNKGLDTPNVTRTLKRISELGDILNNIKALIGK